MNEATEMLNSDLIKYRELIESVLTVLEDADMITYSMLEDWDQDAYHIHHSGLSIKKSVPADSQIVKTAKIYRDLINNILESIVSNEKTNYRNGGWLARSVD